MTEERQPSEMVITGSDLIAGHGGLQPVGEDADLKTTKETSVRAANKHCIAVQAERIIWIQHVI